MKFAAPIGAFLILLISCGRENSKSDDIAAIRAVLEAQQKAWSNNDIEGFMDGYWKSDSVAYFGSSGVTYGWRKMLDRYRRNYPGKAETGTLNFTIADITQISQDAYWVMGEYHLDRDAGPANGTFMIVFKRIDGAWKIIGDSSC